MSRPPAYVSVARFDWWQVRGARWPAPRLRTLGFRRALLPWGELNAPFRPPLDFDGMARLARALAALGLSFGAGRDWSPIEVALDLRDRGLLDGELTEISWRGPGDWQLRTL